MIFNSLLERNPPRRNSFHTFNTLHGQNKQIIISSDRPPNSLVTLEDRLRSRFGIRVSIADIQLPDFETRLAILRHKAEKTGRQVPAEITRNNIRHISNANIRELEGALNRVLAFSDLSGMPMNLQMVDVALSDLLPQQTELNPDTVLQEVANAFQRSR